MSRFVSQKYDQFNMPPYANRVTEPTETVTDIRWNSGRRRLRRNNKIRQNTPKLVNLMVYTVASYATPMENTTSA